MEEDQISIYYKSEYHSSIMNIYNSAIFVTQIFYFDIGGGLETYLKSKVQSELKAGIYSKEEKNF